MESFERMLEPEPGTQTLLIKAAVVFGLSQSIVCALAALVFGVGGAFFASGIISITALYATFEVGPTLGPCFADADSFSAGRFHRRLLRH